jgi:DeoR/GlpR family transcriptional regulator of sugar metabolism
MTVRRDLAALARGGQIRRTHGGAVATEKMAFEFDFRARRQAHRPAKRAIARRAAARVEPGQTLILDTGTTTLELAVLLRDCEDLTVITPSLAVASELQYSEGVRTVLLGGLVRSGSPDLTGAVTEANLEMFAADIAFQGADGIDLTGRLYNADLQIAHVDEKMRQRARQTFILCDSSKIGQTALACNGTLADVDALITDEGIQRDQRRALKKTGATVIVVRREE